MWWVLESRGLARVFEAYLHIEKFRQPFYPVSAGDSYWSYGSAEERQLKR